jgi:hypothetical protein
MIIKAVEADNTIRLLRDIPGALHLVELFLPRSLKQAREQHTKFANEMTERYVTLRCPCTYLVTY